MLENGELVPEHVVLRAKAHRRSDGSDLLWNPEALDLDVSTGLGHASSEHHHRGGLAGSIMAQQAETLILVHLERQTIHGLDLLTCSVGKMLRKIVDLHRLIVLHHLQKVWVILFLDILWLCHCVSTIFDCRSFTHKWRLPRDFAPVRAQAAEPRPSGHAYAMPWHNLVKVVVDEEPEPEVQKKPEDSQAHTEAMSVGIRRTKSGADLPSFKLPERRCRQHEAVGRYQPSKQLDGS
mmetsp:Transcript_108975/g.204429  ORF Transcript_108975/g.204429 Transcript_108975/m.204429 type:complete len:236 (-) Transcript_108975:419-1126(-)